MEHFVMGFDLKPNMWPGVKKFADKNEHWRAQYEGLLQQLGVTRQVWYLFRAQWPGVSDRVVVYTEANNPTVMQTFSNMVASGASPIAQDCQRTCQFGTSSPDFFPPPLGSPLPPGWEIIFT